jgi:hypothetical protein
MRSRAEYNEMFTYTNDGLVIKQGDARVLLTPDELLKLGDPERAPKSAEEAIKIKKGGQLVELTLDDFAFMTMFLFSVVAELSDFNSPFWITPPTKQ